MGIVRVATVKDKHSQVLFGRWEVLALMNNDVPNNDNPGDEVRGPVEPVSEVEVQRPLKAM